MDTRVLLHSASRRRLVGAALALVALAVVALAPTALSAQPGDGWADLTAARAEFERAPWQADFVQTYVPAGFTKGERETGRLAVALPAQLRWDYAVPYPKVFLIRGAEAYTWNPGEALGRRALLEASEREHLALLELDIDELRKRYSASMENSDEYVAEIVLKPLGSEVDIRHAYIMLDPRSRRIKQLSYSDLEGNTTTFELSGHRIVADATLFDPPAALDWLDD